MVTSMIILVITSGLLFGLTLGLVLWTKLGITSGILFGMASIITSNGGCMKNINKFFYRYSTFQIRYSMFNITQNNIYIWHGLNFDLPRLNIETALKEQYELK